MDCFATVDAESVCIPGGVEILARMRDEIEQQSGTAIPMVWFVRFQRRWNDEVWKDTPDLFTRPPAEAFDGFELGKDQFMALQDRGDEIGWHYHANNFAYRPELDRATRLEILHTDLRVCAQGLREKHPEFAVGSFRFGWFFVPDYSVYSTLNDVGITCDASIRPDSGRTLRLPSFEVERLTPLEGLPRVLHGVCVFPFERTILTHDWSVIPHEFEWRTWDAAQAKQGQQKYRKEMLDLARRAQQNRGHITTYHKAAKALH